MKCYEFKQGDFIIPTDMSFKEVCKAVRINLIRLGSGRVACIEVTEVDPKRYHCYGYFCDENGKRIPDANLYRPWNFWDFARSNQVSGVNEFDYLNSDPLFKSNIRKKEATNED